MTRRMTTDIAILGAGVIGLAIAERLLAEGHAVVLVDPAPPGAGASHGNAGTIADYAVQPVGTPAVLRALPSLLFDRQSPLAVRRAALPVLAPWLVRFLVQSRPSRAEANAAAIAALMRGAGQMWQELAARIGAADLLQARGCLYLYATPAEAARTAPDLAHRRRLGVEVEPLSPERLAALEPGLPPMAGGAAFFPGARFLTDPGAVMRRLAAHVAARGAVVLPHRAQRLRRMVDGVAIEGEGLHLLARRVVIAAGAHSAPLAAQAGDPVPLETERGYHVEWDLPAGALPLTRPACPVARGFYLCPMDGRLRVAGTVELGGLTAPPSPHRIARLVAGARALFPDLAAQPDREWMGFRPSLPDSLPVLGPSRAGADVLHAFGHGHVGVTLAPRTAQVVADLIAGRPPAVDLAPTRPGRF
jgi:D-amino-acid dehydrogenase